MNGSEKKADNRPVGVFDSGIGGLTVAAELARALPNEDIVYLGDTARVPYGNKSVESITDFAVQDVEFLLEKGVKMIVAACNTVSAVALTALRRKFPKVRFLGVIDAGVAAALESRPETVTVIATRATVMSDAYRRSIHAADCSVIVKSISCPLLVPFAEEGIVTGPLTEPIFDLYLKDVKAIPPDVLLLGCTHYPLFRGALAEYFGPGVRMIDSASACAAASADYIRKNGIGASPGKTGEQSFFVTDLPSAFYAQATRFLGHAPSRVEKIVLGGGRRG